MVLQLSLLLRMMLKVENINLCCFEILFALTFKGSLIFLFQMIQLSLAS